MFRRGFHSRSRRLPGHRAESAKFRRHCQRPGSSWLQKRMRPCLRWSPNALRNCVDTGRFQTPLHVFSGIPFKPAGDQCLPQHAPQLLPDLGRLRKIKGRRKSPPSNHVRRVRLLPRPRPPRRRSTEEAPTSVGYTLFGEFVACRNGKEILVGVFEALAERDPTFIERFVARPRHGTKRRYLAVDPTELHPADPSRARRTGYTHELKSGYWLLLLVDHRARANMIRLGSVDISL